MKKSIVFLLLIGCFLFSGCKHESYLNADDELFISTSSSADEQVSQTTDNRIYVQVSGCVEHPGVYELSEGARVYEAIDMAGGLTAEADASDLNQALQASDGQMIYVMSAAEKEEAKAQAVDDGKVNINTADEQTLMMLPGIGASKASSIVTYREKNGNFTNPEDLMNITGIKEGVFNKIKDRITVGL